MMDHHNKNRTKFSQVHLLQTSTSFTIRLAIFSLLWLLLTEWQLSSLIVGSFFIIAASLLGSYLAATHQQTTQTFKASTKIISFLYYFFTQSLRSGWGIAKLALSPKSNIYPGFITYRTDLLNDSQIFAFIQILNLLPGTVSAGRNGCELAIHVLDLNSFNRSDIDDCQQWVAQLTDVPTGLPSHKGNS